MADSSINRIVLSYVRSTEKNAGDTGYDKKELATGIKVEKEHADLLKIFKSILKKHDIEMPLSDEEVYATIARAHLDEKPNYYSLLMKHVEDGGHKEAMDFTSISSVLQAGKPLNDRELSRAIRIAIAAEHDAVHLYELIADSTENSDIKEVLSDIGDEEKIHTGELEVLLNTLDRENKKLQEKGNAESKKLLK